MKQTLFTSIILFWSLFSFAQSDSIGNIEGSSYEVNKFGVLVSNIQPDMPRGIDAYGKTSYLKLDSIFRQTVSSARWTHFAYGDNGQLDRYYTKYIDDTFVREKRKYFYDATDLIERKVIETKNNDTDTYRLREYHYQYNQDSLLQKELFLLVIDGNLDTINSSSYSYDINGELIYTESYRNNDSTNIMEISGKENYFLSQGKLDSSYAYSYSNSVWEYMNKKQYYYDTLSKLYLKKVVYENGSSSETHYEYYPSGLTKYFIQCRNVVFEGIQNCCPTHKSEYIYDSNQNMISSSSYRNIYSCNYMQIIEWHVYASELIMVNPNEYANDLLYKPESSNGIGNIFNNINIPSQYFYSQSLNENEPLELFLDSKYFYSSFQVGINTQIKDGIEIIISPNPFKESFIINSQGLEKGKIINIYNIVGELIKSEAINSKEEVINLPNIASGVYFIRILDKDNTILATKKIIKI